MMRFRSLVLPGVAIAGLVLVPACQRTSARRPEAPDSVAVARADSIAVRNLVLEFGSKMQQIALQSPDSALSRAYRAHYGTIVANSLIIEWVKNRTRAPGRLTSSPWPERIEILNLARKSPRAFLVDAEIVERTSAEAAGDAGRIPIRLAIWKAARQWRINDYDQGERRSPSETASWLDDPDLTPDRAAAVVRSYYDALQAKRFHDAYQMWEADGAASGQALIEFVNGWAQFSSLETHVGPPGAIGAAAGSRYVDVPIRVTTVDARGERETRAGTVTLRRSVVDGATSKQRTWRIYTISLHPERAA